MERRSFIKNAGLLAAGCGLGATAAASSTVFRANKLPAWKGFNLLDFFSPDPSKSRRPTPEDHFRWMRDWGFNFVRVPIAYPNYLAIDRNKKITPEEVYRIDEARVAEIEKLVTMAHRYGMHVSLNLHRAPGYCINAGFYEPYNLWKDQEAQDAFCFHWNFWARRFRSVAAAKLSFDLVNEPAMREDMNDQHSPSSAVPGAVYRKVAAAAAAAIRKENPARIVIADGNNVGNTVIPEIIDLDIAQSCRGYYPGRISHYKAPWANKDVNNLPEPKWPGKVGNEHYSREMLEKYYQPWIDLVNKGVGVHCGECGCWNKTPHAVFLAWFGDVLDILGSHGIGFGLWEFSGDFGVLNSRRADVQYENWYGQQLDKKLLELLRRS
ncbi:glycoside hydrolase family 5 protein [Chitinophaga cymbidii]|uniref:Endoglucanase n=1 Tax=Chitinophaga cymbidii TaxID=1096750 RepID=A0A512RPF7_9BACT|nr:cellulase family glycosylhydrolase [Chitinophaga cymbidii]GEP97571.1 endoglucanase [Chitinophaga cymbidii]